MVRSSRIPSIRGSAGELALIEDKAFEEQGEVDLVLTPAGLLRRRVLQSDFVQDPD